ncbi:hypothetical protein I7I51_05092 [Histoplasma capsulatum]|uniref:Uncharacterized protein n=1 Tax=Ajellomyces capsulatus TaxID=5037 RepID=A0A8A1M3V6_AJECA|nr:hypothetical protein I7I51_05092 [Histoplasma capsulatum]
MARTQAGHFWVMIRQRQSTVLIGQRKVQKTHFGLNITAQLVLLEFDITCSIIQLRTKFRVRPAKQLIGARVARAIGISANEVDERSIGSQAAHLHGTRVTLVQKQRPFKESLFLD